jgi:adenylate cyclase
VLSFAIVIPLIAVILAYVGATLQTGKPISDPITREVFYQFLFDPLHIKNIIVWSAVVALTQIMLQFNTKFGEGSMWKMILGKYQTPREETRIFMFVDINSSTTMAEKLGDEKYHQLLKDFFSDITNPVLDNKGEIYQYVGDEVVITWKYEEGILHNRCVHCYFDMKLQIAKRKAYYEARYGLLPAFKAGMHCGKVIAGEVGIIKRDITFSGDVLNTTSRIQGSCKEFNVELIASGDVLKHLMLDKAYAANPLGTIKLRGKVNEVALFSLIPALGALHEAN